MELAVEFNVTLEGLDENAEDMLIKTAMMIMDPANTSALENHLEQEKGHLANEKRTVKEGRLKLEDLQHGTIETIHNSSHDDVTAKGVAEAELEVATDMHEDKKRGLQMVKVALEDAKGNTRLS